ncbi:hypothetical protein Leryth_008359 [Lithospermum erythrorhizon]|nr:hypothetical protein Leryth_008359 [Lithospermum erythrorhizon]
MGNLCEHVFKTIKFCRDNKRRIIYVSCFKRRTTALQKMLTCPPFDSLVRDHAVSLAVWVQTQLNAQIGPSSCEDRLHSIQQVLEPIVSTDTFQGHNYNKSNMPCFMSQKCSTIHCSQSSSNADDRLNRLIAPVRKSSKIAELYSDIAVQMEHLPSCDKNDSAVARAFLRNMHFLGKISESSHRSEDEGTVPNGNSVTVTDRRRFGDMQRD